MSKLRSYILPMAIILGLLLHSWCSLLAWIVPYFIFIILLLNFVAVTHLLHEFVAHAIPDRGQHRRLLHHKIGIP